MGGKCHCQRTPFELKPISPVACLAMMILRGRVRQSELPLHAMPQLVHNQTGPDEAIVWQGEKDHRPVRAGPFEGSVRQIHVRRDLAAQNTADRREPAFRVWLIGVGDPRLRGEQEQPTA